MINRVLIPLLGLLAAAPAHATTLTNDRYQVELLPDGAFRLSAGEAAVTFQPEFTVLKREQNPGLALRHRWVPGVTYAVETWSLPGAAEAPIGEAIDAAVTRGDGWDTEEMLGEQTSRTPDLWRAGARHQLRLGKARVADNAIEWAAAEVAGLRVSARLSLPAGGGEPHLAVTATSTAAGWFGLGYTGAPQLARAAVTEIFQPLIWTRARFPERPYMTSAFRATIPGTLVQAEGQAYGVFADPSLWPFQPLPRPENSQFGIAVSSATGDAQPTVWVPILGGLGSQRAAGECWTFDLRPLVRAGTLFGAYQHVARGMLGVADTRRNDFVSLNTTLNNVIDYGLSPWSRFDEDLRGSSYETDVPGTVNNVSSLHPLSLAALTDDESIYWRRFVPILEAGLSRSKRLFTTDPTVTGQGAVHTMEGPWLNGSELAELARIGRGRVDWMAEAARSRPGGVNRLLALHQATGEAPLLRQALGQGRRAAISFLETPSTTMRGMGFWTSVAPWISWLELYERTGDAKVLEAAVEGAREYIQFIWQGPIVPQQNIRVNEGGFAPLYWYMARHGKTAMPAPEADVPAWRLSEIGLTAESSGTSGGHRAIFLAIPMPTLLRLGYLTDQPYFRDLARHALVGRSANFPGYHINTARSNVYEAADYPLRPLSELSYNSFHYNHVWPHAAMLVDFLITDVWGKSRGQIRFPSHFAEGYGYLQGRVYGIEPGQFHDQSGALPWLPKRGIQVDDVEINWLAVRLPDGLGLALSNQSPETRQVTLSLDPELFPELATGRIEARRWDGPTASQPVAIERGRVTLSLPPHGLVSLHLPGVTVPTPFALRLGTGAKAGAQTEFGFAGGGGRAHLVTMGKGLSHGYVFLRAQATELASVQLRQRQADGSTLTLEDAAFPFEFSVRLPDDTDWEFELIGTRADGRAMAPVKVSVKGTPAASR